MEKIEKVYIIQPVNDSNWRTLHDEAVALGLTQRRQKDITTVKEITGKTIAYLKEHENVNPANLHVYIGPAICQNNFEVEDDVVEKVKAMSFDTSAFIYHTEDDKKSFVDNKGLNRQQCLNAGVLAENIRMDKNCTFANQENFFSYRKDKDCGRHCSFIMIK